jgi:hypothetical protein
MAKPGGSDPGSAATLADRVAHYQERRDLAHVLWLVELLAALSIAIADPWASDPCKRISLIS